MIVNENRPAKLGFDIRGRAQELAPSTPQEYTKAKRCIPHISTIKKDRITSVFFIRARPPCGGATPCLFVSFCLYFTPHLRTT